MIDFSYLERGLDGLANAHRGGAMAGHPGAALVAAYCFTENNPSLDPGVFRAIERDLERILGGEEGFWIDKKSGVTTQDLFQPLPKVEGAEDGKVGAIVDALGGNLDRTRQSGHNVIFAAAAIRAFSDHPELATPERLLGIVKLTESFDKAGPGRGYYGKSVGWKATIDAALPGDVAKESFESFDQAAEAVIDELIATAGEHRQGFGGLMHLIDHVAGLVELDRHGFSDAARKGLPALRQHLRLLHSLP
ncbi:MAG: hypothetical protein KDL87_02875, partial [Verrucomicrobiae bacterium]|nr:hypothetical protein [Verrucomicrobiae bacterium]